MNKVRIAALSLFASASTIAASAHAQSEAKTPVVSDSFVQLYGHIDLSIDDATKGISGRVDPAPSGTATTAQGRLGWQSDISSNLSYLGVRGGREIASGIRGVFQLETQVDMSATPGSSRSSSSSDDSVKGALASRNSYLGIAGGFGAVKVGKTDAPYKLSTARMDPFSASVGDYNSIMGNTGGDNRAEFDTRLSHSVWYESPNFGGLHFNVLFSPGQNRSADNTGLASGEPNCTGGDNAPCNDGSFDNAYSADVNYQAGPLYLTGAYELHKRVNRTTDEAANGGAAPDGSIGIADEHALKAGAQYAFSKGTTVNVIYERITRNAPDPNFNERDRSGFWLAVTQKVAEMDDVNVGWAHAGKEKGDVGTRRADGTFDTGPVDNASNLFTLGYKHHFDKQANWYAVYARQANHNGAHYDLGASGHGITTDCHDAQGECFAGATVQAFSVGMQYNF
jgi:predicted porin